MVHMFGDNRSVLNLLYCRAADVFAEKKCLQ